MKVKAYLSKVLITLGCLFVFYAVVLFVQNQNVEQNAQVHSTTAVEQITKEIENVSEETEQSEEVFIDIQNDEDEFSYNKLNEEITLDNESYVGILTIPSLGLELAIQSQWSYEKLANTPCVYLEEPFSIAGHNYTSHFGKLAKIEENAQVIFTDTSGEDFIFTVVSVNIVNESEIEALMDDSYDLTLFTCNYSNNTQRILVRLNYLDY